jgi:hypothetical protein
MSEKCNSCCVKTGGKQNDLHNIIISKMLKDYHLIMAHELYLQRCSLLKCGPRRYWAPVPYPGNRAPKVPRKCSFHPGFRRARRGRQPSEPCEVPEPSAPCGPAGRTYCSSRQPCPSESSRYAAASEITPQRRLITGGLNLSAGGPRPLPRSRRWGRSGRLASHVANHPARSFRTLFSVRAGTQHARVKQDSRSCNVSPASVKLNGETKQKDSSRVVDGTRGTRSPAIAKLSQRKKTPA